MKIEGAVLRAAMECAAKPLKDRPEFWTAKVRVAHYATGVSVVESTNGIMLFRLQIEQDHEGEAFVTRDIISRIKPTDRVSIDGLDMEVEAEDGSFDIRASLLAVPEPALMVDGKNLRTWPDFVALIPKGKREAASMIGLSSDIIGKVSRAAKHLSTAADALALRMEAGGAGDPVKLVGRSVYGDVVFLVMPTTIAGTNEDQAKGENFDD